MLNTASIIFLSLFFLSSVAELVFAFLENEKIRKIIKPFCLLFLVIFAIIAAPKEIFIYIGALFGLLGDVFLLSRKSKMYFALGTVAFLFGHLFYAITLTDRVFPFYLNRETPLEVYLIALAGIILLTLIFIPFSSKIAPNKLLMILGSFYIAFLLSLSGFAIYGLCISKSIKYLILVLIGGISFVGSDALIIRTRFVKEIKKGEFFIMLLYLLGQYLIVSGLILTTNLVA